MEPVYIYILIIVGFLILGGVGLYLYHRHEQQQHMIHILETSADQSNGDVKSFIQAVQSQGLPIYPVDETIVEHFRGGGRGGRGRGGGGWGRGGWGRWNDRPWRSAGWWSAPYFYGDYPYTAYTIDYRYGNCIGLNSNNACDSGYTKTVFSDGLHRCCPN